MTPRDRLARVAVLAGVAVLGGSGGEALADPTISFRFSSYDPSSVRIQPGQSFPWTADPGTTFDSLSGHPLQFADPTIPPQLDKTTSATRTFGRIGRFPFSC